MYSPITQVSGARTSSGELKFSKAQGQLDVTLPVPTSQPSDILHVVNEAFSVSSHSSTSIYVREISLIIHTGWPAGNEAGQLCYER